MQSSEEKYEWISHVYAADGYLNEITDDGKYWNHSEEPNTVSGVNGDWDSTFAKRDILAGEVRIRSHAICILRLHPNVIYVLHSYIDEDYVLPMLQFIVM
jgi:hypothetical protein